MAIKKIKLTNGTSYDLVDASALHSADIDTTVSNDSDTKVASASAVKKAYDKAASAYTYADGLIAELGSYLTFKGTKATEAEIKAVTLAKIGDVYLETANHSEWVCIEAISGTASSSSWEKLGFDVSAASATHTHTIGKSTGKASKVSTTGSVTAGSDASFTRGVDSFTANTPTTVSITESNGNVTFSITNGTAAKFTQGVDSFSGGKATSVTLPTFSDVDVVTSIDASTSTPVG